MASTFDETQDGGHQEGEKKCDALKKYGNKKQGYPEGAGSIAYLAPRSRTNQPGPLSKNKKPVYDDQQCSDSEKPLFMPGKRHKPRKN